MANDVSVYDYVVVGLGSAGAVVAAGLAARGHRVLGLEAGGTDLQPQIALPAGMMKMPRKNYWPYQVEPDATRNGKRDMWASGKVLGGGSAVNAMLWVRGHRDDFDEWAELGATGWDYDSMLPLMRELETSNDHHGPSRGEWGPQQVSRVRLDHPVVRSFIRGATEVGFPYLDDYNADEQVGVAWSQLSQHHGLRHTSARAFLGPAARKYRNLRVTTHAVARRILFEGNRATGVEYLRKGKVHRVTATKEVIVCAGAIATPALLLRSGVGAAESVAALNVPVVADVPGVGQNLQEHTTVRLQYQVNIPTLNQEMTPAGVVRGGYQLLAHRSGPATAPLANAVLFGRLDGASTGRADYQVMFAPLSLAVRPDSNGSKQNVQLADNSVISALVALLHPRARGSVTVHSTSPDELPEINLEYLSQEQDVADMIAAARQVREIFTGSTEMRALVTEEDFPGVDVRSDEQWQAFLREKIQNCAHWVGTTRMGSFDDPDVVVDPALRVRGVDGLRIADASVMPTITSGNTNAPAILIGANAVRLVARA